MPSGFGPENEGFADPCLTTWLWRHALYGTQPRQSAAVKNNGAVDETRTRDLRLGKATLYQLSYYRKRIVWCGRRDSNSYASRHQILNLARLPFRHARTKLKKNGDPSATRTRDPLIKSQMLYRLS